MASDSAQSVFSIRRSAWDYRLGHLVLTLVFAYSYSLCFDWNPLYALIMVGLFAYSVSTPAINLMSFIYYLRTPPLILKGRQDILEGGLPSNLKVAFFRPIFAKTTTEMDSLLSSMRKDMINNLDEGKKASTTAVGPSSATGSGLTLLDLGKNLKYLVIDNTRDAAVKEYTQNAIRKLQGEFGEDTVFYFHRNVKCDFFKKLGIYMDSLLFIYEGKTRPSVYTQAKWEPWAKGTRNPQEPLFDVILGDLKGLGIQGAKEDVLAGRDVVVDSKSRVELSFVSDADNVWPKGEVRKLIAKMLHPENRHVAIYQPTIRVSNPNENRFIKLAVLNREMMKFLPVVRWRLFRFSPFYGKGAMKLDNYIQEIIHSEKLHPGKAASHDFQEALWALTVLVEDVYIDEKTFSNKIAELKRDAQWRWGDLETVRQYFLKPFEIGRKTHLYVLLRGIIGDFVFGLWLVGMVLGLLCPFLMKLEHSWLLYLVFAVILACLYGIPRFVFPFINVRLEERYKLLPAVFGKRSPIKIVWDGVYETFVSVLVHSLDLLYKPRACLQNYINQVKGKPFVWKTGAMGELETAQMNLFQIYKSLYPALIVGFFLALGVFTGLFPKILVIILSPFIASFILGPFLIWATRK